MSTDETAEASVVGGKRLAALGAAVLVTVLTCAGALGIGPAGGPEQAAAATTSSAPDTASGPPADTASGLPAGGAKTKEPPGDGWVTLAHRPAHMPPETGNATTRRSASKTKGTHAVPAHSGRGKRIVYDISAQRVWLVNSKENAKRTYLVSGGVKPGLLDPGRYRVYSKSRHAVAVDQTETMNFMVRFAAGKHSPIGFHDIPALPDGTLVESRSQLGTPQSAGCIRQWISDAKTLWEFAPEGTRVVVLA